MTPSRRLIVRFNGQVLITSTVSGATFAIGRLPDSALVLPDASVSNAHAEIRIESGHAILVDLGSEHGTFVGDSRVLPMQPHVLKDGLVVRIGPYEITYRSDIDLPIESAKPVALAPPERPAEVVVPVDEGPLFAARRRNAAHVGPNGSMGRYLPYLPGIFHENDFLSRFLQIFETIWEPLEQRQDFIDIYFSPRTCPTSWLPWIASWFGLKIEPYLPEARARALLAEAIEIYRWRGTRYGLARIIEVCLGIRPDIVERPDEPYVFRVVVTLPANAGPDVMATLRELVSAHKPAHMGYVIEVQR